MLKKLTKFEWLGVGAWLVIVVTFGVMSRSLHTAYQWLVIGVFFCAPILMTRMIGTGHKIWRIIGLCVWCAWLGIVAFGFLNIVERIYLVNGEHYPRWLADGEISPKDPLQTERICHRGVVLYSKPNGLYVWRCGSFWYDSTTLISTFNPYELKGAERQ